jgi:hypothetical protein
LLDEELEIWRIVNKKSGTNEEVGRLKSKVQEAIKFMGNAWKALKDIDR